MAEEQKGIVAAGFSLLWRRQGILWWVFVVNVLCGAFGTISAVVTLSRVLHHTLAGEKLSRGFSIGMMVELLRLPNVKLMSASTSSYLFAFVFFVFMLFASGGILETYRLDRRLTTGEFFAASGAFFWRFLRLMLLSIIPFVIVGMIYQGLDKFSDKIGDKVVADQVGAYLSIAAVVVMLLLGLLVRLWFDIAQVRAVAQNETRMWRNTWRAFRITWRELGHLYRAYFCISFFAWATLAIGLLIWVKLPPTATPVTFILLELILFAHMMTRLWQMASVMTWYKRHAEMVPADVVDYTTPHPQEVLEAPLPSPAEPGAWSPDTPAGDVIAQAPSSPPTTDRRPDAELELPPADA
jgi:hypothetical protein